MTAPHILVFATTHQTMQAESLLKEAGFEGLLVLKPKGLVGNCGLALQLGEKDLPGALSLLGERQIVPAGNYLRGTDDRWENTAP
jgi:hypothetical protein